MKHKAGNYRCLLRHPTTNKNQHDDCSCVAAMPFPTGSQITGTESAHSFPGETHWFDCESLLMNLSHTGLLLAKLTTFGSPTLPQRVCTPIVFVLHLVKVSLSNLFQQSHRGRDAFLSKNRHASVLFQTQCDNRKLHFIYMLSQC